MFSLRASKSPKMITFAFIHSLLSLIECFVALENLNKENHKC